MQRQEMQDKLLLSPNTQGAYRVTLKREIPFLVQLVAIL